MLTYFCITVVANIVAALIFYKSINISAMSIVPLFLITLMIFQAHVFKNEKIENGFRTVYGSNLTADEENGMMESGANFMLCTVPFMIPFILFFPSLIKALSVLIYLFGLLGGLLIYRFKNKRKIHNRMVFEEKERREQEKKEELGK